MTRRLDAELLRTIFLPAHAPAFIANQYVGALAAVAVMRWLILREEVSA